MHCAPKRIHAWEGTSVKTVLRIRLLFSYKSDVHLCSDADMHAQMMWGYLLSNEMSSVRLCFSPVLQSHRLTSVAQHLGGHLVLRFPTAQSFLAA